MKDLETVHCAWCPETPFKDNATKIEITPPGSPRRTEHYLCPKCQRNFAHAWYTVPFAAQVGEPHLQAQRGH